MDRTIYRQKGISLLNGIVKQRDWLMKHHKSYVESDWAKEQMNNIRFAIPRLVDASQVRVYLERKETALRLLIPTTNKKRHEELRELIHAQLN